MSTRYGMADSRCTNWLSSRIATDTLLENSAQMDVFEDSAKFRVWMQHQEVSVVAPEGNCNLMEYADWDK